MPELIVEAGADGVALLRINRPERRNALSIALRDELAVQISALARDEAVRAIVLTGDEQAFAAGADIGELAERRPGDVAFKSTQELWRALERCETPLIAAINGYALGGGCELALHCDILVVGHGAKLGLPEVKVGIMPGAGGTQRLLRALGKYRAMRWLLTGDFMSGAAAYEMGLASELVEDAEVLPRALALARQIAGLPPLAVAAIKEAVLLGQDTSLPAALAIERKAFQLLFNTEDRTEGMSAYAERRTPRFKGR